MIKQIFVNLGVADLDRSIAFFRKMGFSFNQQFTDETATCMVMSDTIFAMLMVNDRLKDFTPKDLVDAHKATEVLVALSVESRERVDELMQNALDAGAKEPRKLEDHGWMYNRCFEDLDGHMWELLWMDPAAAEQAVTESSKKTDSTEVA